MPAVGFVRVLKVEGLYYLCSENKGADQLRDLRLCLRKCKNRGSHDAAQLCKIRCKNDNIQMNYGDNFLIFTQNINNRTHLVPSQRGANIRCVVQMLHVIPATPIQWQVRQAKLDIYAV